jgi:methylaspartate mutase sigma subunit
MNQDLNIILLGTHSDSHTWNLIFMELFLKENNCQVRNLGACVSIEEISEETKKFPPDLIIVSSINGHLFQDGIKIINSLNQKFPKKLPPLVIGGRMGVSVIESDFQKKKLHKLGYEGVFVGQNSLIHFKKYLNHFRKDKEAKPLRHAF